MRIAVFSDIHGNPFACKAVLDAVAEDGIFDAVAVAGDLCASGSDPAGCVDMLRKAGVAAVYGNADEYVFAPEKPPPDEEHLSNWKVIQAGSLWTRGKLGEERIFWLAGLPFELRFSPTSNPSDDLLVVHANPKNTHDYIGPPFEEQAILKGKIDQPDDDPTLISLLEDEHAGVIAFGHLHYTSLRYWKDKRLVNVSPCSISVYDRDKRARYSVFNWDGESWHIKRRYIAYNYLEAAEAIRASDIPNKEAKARAFD